VDILLVSTCEYVPGSSVAIENMPISQKRLQQVHFACLSVPGQKGKVASVPCLSFFVELSMIYLNSLPKEELTQSQESFAVIQKRYEETDPTQTDLSLKLNMEMLFGLLCTS
jgi:hypothetical protein